MKQKWWGVPLCAFLLCSALTLAAEETASRSFTLEQAEQNFGVGFFRREGFKSFIEPRVSFVKRKPGKSEVIEYSWRPMVLDDMPHRERIDLIRCSFNFYRFPQNNKKVFYGAGVGGNVVLFNEKLKDWAKTHRNIDLKDGVNGLGRLFLGCKLQDFTFANKVYPVVARVDAFFSPPYRFGASLHRAGEELKLTEVTFGISFSIE